MYFDTISRSCKVSHYLDGISSFTCSSIFLDCVEFICLTKLFTEKSWVSRRKREWKLCWKLGEEFICKLAVEWRVQLAVTENPLEVVLFRFLKLVVTLYVDSRKYDDSMTLFVWNLPNKATGDSVLELFGDNAKSVYIPTRRYGFVEFNSIESRDAAIGKSWELDGCQLNVQKANSKQSGTFSQCFRAYDRRPIFWYVF